MEKSRLFHILYYLLNHGRTTAQQLAEEFEVSTRTIYRDIDRLSMSGIPIYANSGHDGGIEIDSSYILDKTLITREELEGLIQIIDALEDTNYYDLNLINQKLKSLTSNNETTWMKMNLNKWGDYEDVEQVLFKQIKDAILHNQTIYIEYYNSAGLSKRKIDPYYLEFKGSAWYVEGYCHKRQATRYFRLSRITQLELLKETYESKQFDKQENKMHESNEYYEFIFSEKSAYRAYDTFAKSAISDCDEGVCVKVNMPVNYWIYSFLLSLGNEVKVIEPKYIKKELLQLHKNIIRKMEEEQ